MPAFELPGKIIPRKRYLDKIEPFIGKNIIKVFTGQRRVGKSYLLMQLIRHIQAAERKSKFIYINKEDLAFDFIKTARRLHDYVLEQSLKNGKTYVFIDEIQDVPGFEKALRSLALNDRLDLYCTGSNANLLSGELAGMLSGRFVEFSIYSLSYPEFLEFHQLADSDETLEKYLKYGGLPYLIHLPMEDDVVFEYIKNIYATIVYRDIIHRHSIRNVRFLEQLVLFLAGNTGSLFTAKKISDYLKSQKVNMASNQIQTYVSYLVSAFLLHRVERYDIIGKRIFEIGEKFYFENTGIRNALWGYRIEDRSKMLENAVHNHLLYEGYAVMTGSLLAREIDFVCEKKGEKIYVQAALALKDRKTIEREFGNLMDVNDNYPKLVVTMDPFSGNTYRGIAHLRLREFLMR